MDAGKVLTGSPWSPGRVLEREGGRRWTAKGSGTPTGELAFRPASCHSRLSHGGVAGSGVRFRKRAWQKWGAERGTRVRWDEARGRTGPWKPLEKSKGTNDARAERSQRQCGCVKDGGFQRVPQLGDPSGVGGDKTSSGSWLGRWVFPRQESR